MSLGHGAVLAGRFRLEDLLSDHDGARFWRAEDTVLSRDVAVHVIAADDPRVDAMLEAARLSATATDIRLLRVLDASAEDDTAYVVHEWGQGESVDRLLADGPISPRRAAWLVREVAETLTATHLAGLAHGHLMPENVLVDDVGSVKLIGFQVDRVLRGEAVWPVTGESLDPEHSDLVNLAALLYACLVGKWPGTVGSALPEAPVDHGHVLRPRQVRAGIPRALDEICHSVLGPRGEHPVISTAHEIAAALSDYAGDPPTSVPLVVPDRLAAAGAADPEQTQAFEAVTETGDLGIEPTRLVDEPVLAAAPDPRNEDRRAEPTARPDRPGALPPPVHDPDATQAGVPVFYDDDTGVGWIGTGAATGVGSGPVPVDSVKPLFAPGGAREAGRDQTPAPSAPTRPGAGTPPVTPPAEDDWPWAEDDDDRSQSWLKLAAVVAAIVVLVVALFAAFDLGQRNGGDPSGPSADPSATDGEESPSQRLRIAEVSDFDPLADPPEENSEAAPLAADGDPTTGWYTSTYEGNPRLGLLKDGVGLLVDLGREREVSRIDLRLAGSPTSVEVLAAPEGSSPPTGVAGLRELGAEPRAGESVRLDVDTVTTRYLVVWLTSLPPVDGGFRGEIREIVVRS